MTRGLANIIGAALVGAFFLAVAAGMVGLVMEMEGRDLSVRGDERRKLADSEVRAKYPPGFLAVAALVGAGALGGALLGMCVMAIPALFLGRRRQSYLIDAIGVLGGALVGATVGLLLTQTLLLRRDDPWRETVLWFTVIAAAVVGAVQGGFFGAGVRGWLMGRIKE